MAAKKKAKKANPIPKGFRTVTPYITVRGGLAALEFYKKAFGAKVIGKPMLDPSGKVGHAELSIGDSRMMLGDESDMGSTKSPAALNGSTAGFCIYVKNVDAIWGKAVAAGATVLQPITDQFYGDRSGRVADPFGHTWVLSTHIEDVSAKEMQRRMNELYGPKS